MAAAPDRAYDRRRWRTGARPRRQRTRSNPDGHRDRHARALPPATRATLATGLIAAVVAAYQVPEERVNVFVQEYAPENRYGGTIDATVIVHALPRPLDRKRVLVERIAAAVTTALDLRPERVNIILQETPLDCSGVGGVLAIDKQRPG